MFGKSFPIYTGNFPLNSVPEYGSQPWAPPWQLKSYSHPQECSRQGGACHSGAKSNMSSCRIHISLLKKFVVRTLCSIFIQQRNRKRTFSPWKYWGNEKTLRDVVSFLCSGFRVSLLIEQLSKKKLRTAKFWGVEDAVLEM